MPALPTDRIVGCASGGVIAGGRHHIGGNQRVSLWGQSNALGRAEGADISASPLSDDHGLAAFYAGTFDRVYIWTGAVYAKLTSSNNGCTAGQFGAEFGMAVRWMRETVSGNLYIEKKAFSGVSITYFDPAGANYPGMVTSRNSANTWLASNGVTDVIDAGFVWIQGETDYTQTQSWYQTRLDALIAARDANALQTAATKRLLMQMAVGSINYSANIVAAKTAIASAAPENTEALPMPYYMKSDNQHQNGRGQVQTGYDAFERIFGAPHIAT